MAMYGLQIWDAQGRLTIDPSYFMGRVLGSVLTGGIAGAIAVPGFATGFGFAMGTLILEQNQNVLYSDPIISISGTTLSWSYGDYAGNHRIFYGVR